MKKGAIILSVLFFLALRIEITSAQDEVRVLVLLSLDVTYPYVKSKVDGLAFEGAKNPKTILLDIHSLEDERFTDPDKLHHYYSTKAEQLKNSNPDVIGVTGSPVIFSFYNNYLYPLLPDVPMVGETHIVPEDHKPVAYSFIEYHQNMPKTIDMALKMLDAKTIFLIGDATHEGSKLSMQLVENYIRIVTDLKIEHLDMPFTELLKTVQGLPEDSIAFYNLIFSDGHGKRMIPEIALKAIAKQAPFPIFAFHETMIGSGAIGGVVAKGHEVGIQLIQESLLSIDRGPFSPPRVIPAVSTSLFDWHYIDKAEISIDKIPEDAELINLTPSLFDQYKIIIITISLAVFIMAFMLVILFHSYRQKKNIAARLSTINQELEHRVDNRTIKLKAANEALKKKEKDITQLMLTDSLTGLPNRRYFEDEFTREFNRSKRTDSDFCIAMCDIDYFKFINDTYGHDIGDKVLVEVADHINKVVRNTDFVARWGGEEFVIMYLNSDQTCAEYFAARVRTEIENLEFSFIEQNITISIGIAQREKGDKPEDVMKRSDQALYYSKTEGRNRITCK